MLTVVLAALICFSDIPQQMEVFDGYVRDDGVSLGCGASFFGYDYFGCTDPAVVGCDPLADYRARGCVCVQPTGRLVDPTMPCVDDSGLSGLGEPAIGWVQWYVLKPSFGQSPICLSPMGP